VPEFQLPPDYHPFRELNLCSNVLVNVPVPISVGGRPALLVGRSLSLDRPHPLAWLAAPAGPNSKDWVFVVERNRPLRPLIVIESDQPNRTIQVRVGGTLVLRAKASTDTAVVDALDLRPLGLLAYGGETDLHIGGQTFGGNRFENLQTAFAIARAGV
jgi:hypothetical protein